MIDRIIQEQAARVPTRDFLIAGTRNYSYEDAWRRLRSFADQWETQADRRWAFYTGDAAAAIIGVAAAAQLRVQSCILNYPSPLSDIEELVRGLEIGVVFSDSPLPLARTTVASLPKKESPSCVSSARCETEGTAEIIILTSGTTGRPKGALYRWSHLIAQAAQEERLRGARWLLTYNMNHFAGFQVLVHALVNAGTLIVPQTQSIADVLQAARQHRAGYLSGTPTFWRMVVGYLEHTPVEGLCLEQITIGGEPVTEDVLVRVRRLFPGVPISQVFATTELGWCFSIKDGLPGFPVSYLSTDKAGVSLKIVDGELVVKSLHSMERYWEDKSDSQGTWRGTGDLVEVVGDRVLFLGRKSEVVNVGGAKVHPSRVESVILKVPGVSNVRVYGVPNPITGQIIAADITVERGSQRDQIEEQVRIRCRHELDRYHQPRRIRVIESLPSLNQKVLRRADAEA